MSRRLPACVRVVVFSPPSEGIPTPSSANVGSDSFFSFIFFCVSRMERRRYLSYPKRHCALSTHPYPHYDITMRLKTHTKPRRLRRALWTRPFRRAGQENVFRLPVRVTCSRLILLVSCASLLFATHATVYVYVPRRTHPSLPPFFSRAPQFLFLYLISSSLLSSHAPFILSFPLWRIFSLSPPLKIRHPFASRPSHPN